ncbi:ABC transporter permease [Candidatus Hodarchaeum mangrovi]
MKFLSRYFLKKLKRDIFSQKFVFLALIILSFSGVGSYLALTMGYSNLETSYQQIYRQTNFADAEVSTHHDVWFNVSKIIPTLTMLKQRHPEVQNFNYRLIMDSGFNLTTETSKGEFRRYYAGGRVIGIKGNLSKEERINDLIIEEGDYFSQDTPENNILLEAHFAQRFDLKVGSSLVTRILNVTNNFTIEGIVFSPEYLVIIPSSYDFLPTSIFGIIFTPLQQLQEITNLHGLANNLLIEIKEKVDVQTRNRVINNIWEELNLQTNNSFMLPVMQEYQISNLALRLDLETFKELAFLLPLIVLSVASIAIYITTGRIVQSQKRNIGIAACLGYYSIDILLHYSCFSIIIGATGSILGIIGGIIISQLITGIYAYFMRFPQIIEINYQLWIILLGFIAGTISSLLGGLFPAWKASRLVPREAIQITPSFWSGKKTIIERIIKYRNLNLKITISLRNLFRQRVRTSATLISLAAAVMILVVSLSFIDSINNGIYRQFNETSHYDITIKYEELKFFDLGVDDQIKYLKQLPGIISVEPVLQLPSIIESGGHIENILITAWNTTNPTVHFFQWQNPKDSLQFNNSIVLCPSLARVIGVKSGDIVKYGFPDIPALNLAYIAAQYVWNAYSSSGIEKARNETKNFLSNLIQNTKESLSFSQEKKEVRLRTTDIKVTGISKEIWGNIIYTTTQNLVADMGLDIFKSGFDIDLTPVTQLILKVTQPDNLTYLGELQSKMRSLEGVRSIEYRADFQSAVKSLLNVFNIIIFLLMIFSCLLAAATIFTAIYVNYEERKWEIATMLTLGLSDSEFIQMFSLENLFQACFSMILGFPIGIWMSTWLLDNILRVFYFEIIISLSSILSIITGVIFVVLISQLPALYHVLKLNLTIVTKEITT